MAKYCTQCGRKLEDGEVCTCTSQNNDAIHTANEQAPGGSFTAGSAQTSQTTGASQESQNGQQYHQPGQQPGQQQYQQYQQQGQQQYQQYQQQGQPGGYTKEAEWINKQKDAFVSGTKSMFSEILPILKSPVSRVRKISSSGTASTGIQLIIAKTVIFLIVVIIGLFMTARQINEASYGFIEAEIPYFQAILLTLILTAGIDFLEAVILKVITGAFNSVTNINTMITIIGARGIYDTFIFLIVIILGLMAWEVALAALVFLSPISVYIQFASYQGCVNMAEDKKPYAYFLAKLCIGIISFLVVYLLIRSSLGSLISSLSGGLL